MIGAGDEDINIASSMAKLYLLIDGAPEKIP
jgi:hypothetical protein